MSYRGHSFYALNLLYLQKGHLLGLIPSLGHQLPDCQKASVPYELGHRKQGGLPQVLAGELVPLTPTPSYPNPTRAYSGSSTP